MCQFCQAKASGQHINLPPIIKVKYSNYFTMPPTKRSSTTANKKRTSPLRTSLIPPDQATPKEPMEDDDLLKRVEAMML